MIYIAFTLLGSIFGRLPIRMPNDELIIITQGTKKYRRVPFHVIVMLKCRCFIRFYKSPIVDASYSIYCTGKGYLCAKQ